MNPDFQKIIEAENSPVFSGLFPALDSPSVTSVKFNVSKCAAPVIEETTKNWQKVPWEPNGFYIDKRPLFVNDPMWHQGLYYVQEASSMIIGAIIKRISEKENGRGLNFLDCCAAPGGKTTSILSAMPEGSAVIANEYDFKRAEILRENLYKWGSPAVAIVRGDTDKFRKVKNCFDVIVADMPCSGEGMFRKDAEARNQWSLQLVERCAQMQREIAANVLPSLKSGGYFFYSTCTFNTTENEKNVERIAEDFGLESVEMCWPEEWDTSQAVNSGIMATRFLPSRLKGEGLFVAVLKKPGQLKDDRKGDSHRAKNCRSEADDWVSGVRIVKDGDAIWGMTDQLVELTHTLEKKGISFLSKGTEIATIKGKDIVPHHSLALSMALRRNAFPEIEVDADHVMNYVRRNVLTLESREFAKGYLLLIHNGVPVGFVNNLGRRFNNMFPKEWRVRL